MKLRILSIFIAFASGISAQNNFFLADTNANQIVVNSYGGVASNAIPQNFMNKFIFPGFIDKDLKDEASGKLKDENIFGGEFITDINTYFKPGSFTKNGFWGVGFGTNIEGNLNFTKDLFNLIFYGNKPYAGQTLDLNNTSFEAIGYSHIDFTLGKSYKKNQATHNYWIDLGVVLGHNFTSFNLPLASVYTEPNGSYVDVTIKDGEMAFSDTSSTSLINGFGGKLNLNYHYQSEKTTLLVQAKNIGGISWNSVTSYDIDTTLRFEGIEVDDIFEFSDSVLNEVTTIDSLVNTKKGRAFRMLPIDFNVYYKKDLGKLAIDAIARYRIFTNYNPYVRVGAYYKLPIFTPGVTVAYGGYGSLQVGLNTELNLAKKLKIVLGTNNILGAIVPNSSTALDAYLGMRLHF